MIISTISWEGIETGGLDISGYKEINSSWILLSGKKRKKDIQETLNAKDHEMAFK